jgi:hypothetical protein
MADTKISAATAVITPAATDQYATNQGGVSKRTTRAQMHALVSGEHLVLPQVSEAATPTLAFGDGDSGLYETSDDNIVLAVAGADVFSVSAGQIVMAGGGGGLIKSSASATVPSLVPYAGDSNSGVGRAADDALSLIAGGVEAMRFTEAVGVMQMVAANVGLTADVGSVQGGGVITSTYNVYDTVGTGGDSATLPAVFPVGTLVYIKNGAAANSMDVFPASGDDAGAGADAAVAVAAGAFAVFMGTTANATWEKIMGGTA